MLKNKKDWREEPYTDTWGHDTSLHPSSMREKVLSPCPTSNISRIFLLSTLFPESAINFPFYHISLIST